MVYVRSNNALRVRNVEPLYGFTFPDPIVYGVKTGPDGKQVSVVEDKELEFDEILSAPLPKAPLEVLYCEPVCVSLYGNGCTKCLLP